MTGAGGKPFGTGPARAAVGGRVGLTPRQAELLRYLRANPGAHCDEMKTALGVTGQSIVSRMLGHLAERGYIVRLPNQTPCFALTVPVTVGGTPLRTMFLTPETARDIASRAAEGR